ncbi:MAG: hypothetical protein JWP87_3886 [Labilithrix sp.]|nr:hypothetical protein [Labilithrix sp.]
MRPIHRFFPVLPIVIGVSSAALALACDRAPSADGLKDWAPTDHDGEKKASSNQGPKGDAGGPAALVELTWRNQCQSCHGPGGHGDGPQGPMFKAQDLSRDDWQAGIKDEQIAASIQNGKGRMPKFELPDEIVKGLVGRVRSFRGK